MVQCQHAALSFEICHICFRRARKNVGNICIPKQSKPSPEFHTIAMPLTREMRVNGINASAGE